MVLPIVAAGAGAAGTAAATSAATGAASGAASAASGTVSGASAIGRAASSGVRPATTPSNVTVGPWRGSSASQSTGAQPSQSPIRSARGIRERAQAAGFEYEEDEENGNITRLRRSAQSEEAVQKKEVRYRISLPLAALLVASAIFLDIAEIILFFTTGIGGFIKDIASWLYIIIFWALKAPFWKGSKYLTKINTMIATYLIGIIPGISDFMPELTIGIITVIVYTRIEDRLSSKIKLVKEVNEKIVRFKRSREQIQDNKAA